MSVFVIICASPRSRVSLLVSIKLVLVKRLSWRPRLWKTKWQGTNRPTSTHRNSFVINLLLVVGTVSEALWRVIWYGVDIPIRDYQTWPKSSRGRYQSRSFQLFKRDQKRIGLNDRRNLLGRLFMPHGSIRLRPLSGYSHVTNNQQPTPHANRKGWGGRGTGAFIFCIFCLFSNVRQIQWADLVIYVKTLYLDW